MALTPIQQEFAKFLAGIWTSTEGNVDHCNSDFNTGLASGMFWHQYKITNHHSWNTWKTGNPTGTISHGIRFVAARKTHWWCQSLSDAAHHYSWTASSVGTFAGLATALQGAMRANNQSATADVCRKLFVWGGVAKSPADASQVWVEHHERAGTLVKNIQLAVTLLTPGNSAPLTSFNCTGLLMNSAMTKVYAAANPSVIIYDGRVGAALGLLARLFLSINGNKSVPPELHFLWGASRTNPHSRNPSHGSYVFKSLNDYGIGDCDRADVARKAGSLLSEIMQLINRTSAVVTMHDLEKALFMIGYRVR